MIEKVVLDFLASHIDPVPVYMEVPETRPEGNFVVVQKMGGSRTEKLYESSVAIDSFSDSLWDAATMNVAIQTMMDDLAEDDEVTHVEINSSYNYTNRLASGSSGDKMYRYRTLYEIYHY